ncbi:MAG: DUF192 domain-containing protein [Spiribacter sp.]|jgi:hypothetical protein|nr:DUF192 domain-containing protein [Spiribacter sp.]MDR9489681.1 DUF192 domain-containing protein [Spiribacter sp.]
MNSIRAITLIQPDFSLHISARIATTPLAKLRGLLGTKAPPSQDVGLLLDSRSSIHTLGMRYSIDIAFLDPSLRVLRIHTYLPPNRMRFAPSYSRYCLETAAGVLPAELEGFCFAEARRHHS